MSHIIIFMSIPGEKLSGNTSKENIARIVSETLAPYVEDTAQTDTNIKIDEERKKNIIKKKTSNERY